MDSLIRNGIRGWSGGAKRRLRLRVWLALLAIGFAVSGAIAQTDSASTPSAEAATAAESTDAGAEAEAASLPIAERARRRRAARLANAEPPDYQKRLDEAVEQLTLEARDLLEYNEPTDHPPRFHRPHPNLRRLGPEAADAALQAMRRRHTRSDVLDNYVRWHLMWVYNQARIEDRRDDGRDLLQLIDDIEQPEGIGDELRQEYAYKPDDLWQEYRRLTAPIGSPSVVIGYPPFQKVIRGEAALQQLGPDARARWQQRVEQARINREKAAEIFPRLERVDYPENVAFNRRLRAARDRLRHVRHAIRELHGELIYGLLQTRDPDMLLNVGRQIDREVDRKSRTAFDLLAFVYLAAFDGVLDDYPLEARQEFAQGLRMTARGAKDYWDVGPGHPRNFADYAFTLIYTLREDEDLVREPTPTAEASP